MMRSAFSCVYCPFAYLLWRNVYSDLLPILRMRCLLNYCVVVFFFPRKKQMYDLQCFSLILSSHLIPAFLLVSFETQNFNFDEVQFICIFFGGLYFGIISRKSLLNPRSQRFTPKSFTGSAFTFKSLVHFELVSVYALR